MQYPVFIVGSPRSGTSIMADVLLAIGYFGHREGNFLSVLHAIRIVVDRHFATFSNESPQVLVNLVDKDELLRLIQADFKTVVEERQERSPWFDKTGNPEMIKAIPIIRSMWPSSRFVFAKRRAIENIASRLTKFPDHAFEYHCSNWAENMRAWREQREVLPEEAFIEVDQFDMAHHPSVVANRLRVFLGLEEAATDAAVRTLRTLRPQQTEAGSAERVLSLSAVGWTEDRIASFERLCGPEMRAFGYRSDELYRV